jgi:hypothetical protein
MCLCAGALGCGQLIPFLAWAAENSQCPASTLTKVTGYGWLGSNPIVYPGISETYKGFPCRQAGRHLDHSAAADLNSHRVGSLLADIA